MKLVTKFVWGWSLAGAVATGGFAMWIFGPKPKEAPPPDIPIISLEKLGNFESLKVNYSDVIEFEERRAQGIPWTNWELPLGGTKVLLVAKGDCTVATDLRSAKYENVNQITHTLSLILQTPKLTLATVNHSSQKNGGSYFYAINDHGMEPIIPDSSNKTNAIRHALTVAQKEIETVCSGEELTAIAKKNTEDILIPTYLAVGWNVQFQWQ